MAFLDKNGLQTLTNKLVQGDAIKVASHRGHTVKNVIDNIQRECENIATPNTMTLENRVSEFKVGNSRDVDVSGDVEEGKVEVELKGKTYQNLCYSKILLNSSSLSSYEIEDLEDRIRIVKNTDSIPSWTYFSNNSLKLNMIKPNTNYTLFFRYKTSTPKNISAQFIQGSATNSLCPSARAVNLYNDIYMANIKTYPSFENININGQVIYFTNAQPTNNCDWVEFYKDMILLEGDYSTIKSEELPQYFEGIKSSFKDGIVDVEVQGKNLFDGQLRTFNTNDTYIDNIGQHHNGDNNIPIKPNTSYTMTFETISGDSNIYIWNGNEKVLTIPSGKDTVSFRTPLECNSLSFYRSVADYTKDRLKYKIQLEENSKSTSYEPYYKKKISFNIGEPLRSLPNGVCDEIKNNNGQWELVRRIGKVVLDGSSSTEYAYLTHEKTLRFSIFIRAELELLKPKTASHGICDRIPYMYGNSDDVFHCRFDGSSPYGNLIIWIEKSKLESENPTGLKKWLQSNPTTFYYQLAEPTITPIEPIEFNISQGSTINISSDITPTSTHKVILNRAGQIEQGIELIANLKSRVNELENIYDSNLIATQYKLDNLKLNYELEREED